MNTYNLLAISGSLREKSFNTMLIQAFKALAPEGVDVTIADFSSVPLFNQDDETEFPETVVALKEQIRTADGILIATPEYNRSVPGALKNFIDWTSRPYGDSAWAGKPVYIVGATPAPTGTALAQSDLKKILLYLNMRVLGQPELYISAAHEKFNEEGVLIDERVKGYIAGGIEALTTLIDTVKS